MKKFFLSCFLLSTPYSHAGLFGWLWGEEKQEQRVPTPQQLAQAETRLVEDYAKAKASALAIIPPLLAKYGRDVASTDTPDILRIALKEAGVTFDEAEIMRDGRLLHILDIKRASLTREDFRKGQRAHLEDSEVSFVIRRKNKKNEDINPEVRLYYVWLLAQGTASFYATSYDSMFSELCSFSYRLRVSGHEDSLYVDCKMQKLNNMFYNSKDIVEVDVHATLPPRVKPAEPEPAQPRKASDESNTTQASTDIEDAGAALLVEGERTPLLEDSGIRKRK